jgi:hypothetical protein
LIGNIDGCQFGRCGLDDGYLAAAFTLNFFPGIADAALISTTRTTRFAVLTDAYSDRNALFEDIASF